MEMLGKRQLNAHLQQVCDRFYGPHMNWIFPRSSSPVAESGRNSAFRQESKLAMAQCLGREKILGQCGSVLLSLDRRTGRDSVNEEKLKTLHSP